MNKTRIEWTDYTWNPITGCLNHANGMCKGGGFPCYAYKLANGRLKERYLANTDIGSVKDYFPRLAGNDPFYPRFWPERLDEPCDSKKPAKIFTVDMGELFGDWIPEQWQQRVFDVINCCPQHTFQLLTKQPQNLIRRSLFPENCWVGVTATNQDMFEKAAHYLEDIEATVRFISIEPLLSPITIHAMYEAAEFLDWLIIGSQTKPYKPPEVEWVQEIVEAADKAGIPVFLKDNLLELVNYQSPKTDFAFNEDGSYRQEFPK